MIWRDLGRNCTMFGKSYNCVDSMEKDLCCMIPSNTWKVVKEVLLWKTKGYLLKFLEHSMVIVKCKKNKFTYIFLLRDGWTPCIRWCKMVITLWNWYYNFIIYNLFFPWYNYLVLLVCNYLLKNSYNHGR
jgi:hypothetical protein